MSLSVPLRSVRQANTWSIHHERLFGLTDRSYKALAVNFSLKYCQWLLKTSLITSALFGLADCFTEPNIHLYLITKWFDAISECPRKAKVDRNVLLETYQLLKSIILFTVTGLGQRILAGVKDPGN